MNHFVFKRPCHNCGELFRPSTKYTKWCDECKQKQYDKTTKINNVYNVLTSTFQSTLEIARLAGCCSETAKRHLATIHSQGLVEQNKTNWRLNG